MTDKRQPIEPVTRAILVEVLQVMAQKTEQTKLLFEALRQKTNTAVLNESERDLLMLEMLHMQMLTATGVAALMQQQVNFKDQMREE